MSAQIDDGDCWMCGGSGEIEAEVPQRGDDSGRLVIQCVGCPVCIEKALEARIAELEAELSAVKNRTPATAGE